MTTGEKILFAFIVSIGFICLLVSRASDNYKKTIVNVKEIDKKKGKRRAYEHKERYGEFPPGWSEE